MTMHRRVDRPEQELNTAGVYAEINERLARIGAENAQRLQAMQRKLQEAKGEGEVGTEAPFDSSPVGTALMARKAAWPVSTAAAAYDVLEKGTAVLYQDKQSGEVLEVTVANVHYDDTTPYYSIRLASGQERETVRERLWRKVVRAESPDCEDLELSRTLGPLSPGVKLGWGREAEEEHLVLGPLSPGFQLGWAPRRADEASELIQEAEAEIYMPSRVSPSRVKTAFRQDRLPAGCSGSPRRQYRR